MFSEWVGPIPLAADRRRPKRTGARLCEAEAGLSMCSDSVDLLRAVR